MLKKQYQALGALAVGCMLAAGATQAAQAAGARPDIGLYSNNGKAPHLTLYKYVSTTKAVLPVSNSASGSLNQMVNVDGWALIDQSACTQIGTPHPFMPPKHEHNGTFTLTLVQSVLGNGNCPGTMFTFSNIAYTWTNANATSGAQDIKKLRALYSHVPAKYGLGSKVIIADFVTFTLQ